MRARTLNCRAVALVLALLFALAGGAMLPIQAGINAQLSDWLGSPVRASFVSFAVGTAALLAVMLVAARAWPSGQKLQDAPWWLWIGGLLGSVYVLASVVTAPRLGAAGFIAVILAGQSVCSLVLDHFGWVGFQERPASPGRLAGVVLVAAGVLLIRVL